MKRYFVIIAMAFLLPNLCISQTGNRKTESVSIGIKGGVALPGMDYSDKHLSGLEQDAFVSPIGGIFVNIPLSKVFSIAPEIMFVNRGVKVNYSHFSGAAVHYSIASKYIDLRIPVSARWKVEDLFQPYVFVGVETGYLLGGQIHIDRDVPVAIDQTIDIGKANMATYHAGAYGGLGVRSDIDCGSTTLTLRLEASYHYGFVDSYSEMEHSETAESVNINAYNITGKRKPKGWEICLGVSMPLRFNGSKDACSTFKNKYRPKHYDGTFSGF